MKPREKIATGKINNNGQLSMYMGELNQFFAQNKGANIIARFIVANPGTSEALKGYYFNGVIPEIQKAFYDTGERKTEQQTEQFLREISPISRIEQVDENGNYSYDLKKISDMSNQELIEHIDFIKQFAAEEFGVFINDPNTL